MIELTQERLATIMDGNYSGTIRIGGNANGSIVIAIPFGKSTAEGIYNDLLNLTNEKGAYAKLLQEARDDAVIKDYEVTL